MPFCSEIEIEKLEYKSPTSNRSGGKVVNVSTVPGSYDYKDRLRFQCSANESAECRQTALWGLSTPLPGQDTSRRALELTVETPELKMWLHKLDEHNIKTAVESAPAWFKKDLSDSEVRNMYVPLLKPPTKPGGKDTMRVKVKCAEYPTKIFTVTGVNADGGIEYDKEPGKPEDLIKNVKVMVRCETAGLWFMSRQFGMSLTATDIIVWPNKTPEGIDAFVFNTKPSIRLESVIKNSQIDEDIMMND